MSDPPVHAQAVNHRLLLSAVFVVATCGLVYELITATMASYLLGDSVTQFSLVIGVYLSAMGLGSWLSKFIHRRLHHHFVRIQLAIALLGGFAATLLFFGFAYMSTVRPLLFGLLTVIGTLVGLEIPLLMRMMDGAATLKDIVARVLAFDYLGALAASILFPLVLLPYLGLVRTSLLFGLMNGAVAMWAIWQFRDTLPRPRSALFSGALTIALLTAGFIWGKRLEDFGEHQLYDAPVIFSQKTPYQRLTITRQQNDIRLFIDGNLQFSSVDEHRYHEALVHPAMAAVAEPRKVLILGGGDGLAARELLKYKDVERIDLVDLDPAMTALFKDKPVLAELNHGSLANPRVTVHNEDAMEFLGRARPQESERYDVIIVDLPDPNNFSLGKLYTRSFYQRLHHVLKQDGAAVIQATSPYLAPHAYFCIVETLRAAGFAAHPYHAYVPAFGDWGYVLVTRTPRDPPARLRENIELQFLNNESLAALFVFPADQKPPDDIESNELNDQMLVRYYEQDLKRYINR